MRLRLRVHTNPRPAVVIADSPRPRCQTCGGRGGWEQHYAGPDGEYGGTDDVPCTCWNPDYSRTLLPLPRRLYYRLAARRGGGWSSESPF